MRIAINAVLLGGVETGVEVYIRSLLRHLPTVDATNRYLVFVNRDVDPAGLGLPERFVLHVAPFAHGQRLRRVWWEQFALPRILRREGVDVLHAPGYVMPLRSPAPCVVTIHDILALTHPQFCRRLNALHYGLMLSRTARRAARIIAPSQATKHAIVERLAISAEKVCVVHPGIAETFQRMEASSLESCRAQSGLPPKYILFVGRLEPKKNVRALLAAYAWLKANRHVEHMLVLIGPPSAADRLGEEGVVRLGYVSPEKLRAAYNLADVFAFPSLAEGFGFPPLEAMACGAPVVASNIPVLRETLGDAAILVPPDDPNLLALAIYKVLTNAFLRRTLAERARERARRYNWMNTAKETIRVYEEAEAE